MKGETLGYKNVKDSNVRELKRAGRVYDQKNLIDVRRQPFP